MWYLVSAQEGSFCYCVVTFDMTSLGNSSKAMTFPILCVGLAPGKTEKLTSLCGLSYISSSWLSSQAQLSRTLGPLHHLLSACFSATTLEKMLITNSYQGRRDLLASHAVAHPVVLGVTSTGWQCLLKEYRRWALPYWILVPLPTAHKILGRLLTASSLKFIMLHRNADNNIEE